MRLTQLLTLLPLVASSYAQATPQVTNQDEIKLLQDVYATDSAPQPTVMARDKRVIRGQAINKQNEGSIGILSDDFDTPNQAGLIDVEGVYKNYITKDGDQDWYYVQTPSDGKMTFFLQVPQADELDYHMTVFKLDNGQLVSPQGSAYPARNNEQVSVLASTGDIYFFAIYNAQGFSDTLSYDFLVTHSTQYDSDEADDNINTSLAESQTRIINRTLDNNFDADLFRIYATNPFSWGVYLKPDPALPAIAELLNEQGVPLAIVNGHAEYDLPAGTYYIRVRQNSFVDIPYAQRGYKLHTYMPDTMQSIDSYSLSDVFFEDTIYLVDNHCVKLRANIKDVFGTPIPFGGLYYSVKQRGNNRFVSGTAQADENGRISKNFLLGYTISLEYDADNIWLYSAYNGVDPLKPLLATTFIHFWTGTYSCS